MTLESWAKKYGNVLGALASLAALLALGWAIFWYFFTPPQLAMTVETSDLRMPLALYARMARAINADSARMSDSSATALRQVRGFLRDTKTFTEIKLANTSRVSLSNLDLRFRYVHDVDGWAIESDNLDNEEQTKLNSAVRYDELEGMLTLHGISRLPPKSTLSLFVWGNVSAASLLGSDQLTVTYDGGAGEMISERTIRGFDVFLYDDAGLTVIIMLLVNMFLWVGYLSWSEKRLGSATAPVAVVPLEKEAQP